MYCAKCGKQTEDTDRFCQYCGTPTEIAENKNMETSDIHIEKEQQNIDSAIYGRETDSAGNGNTGDGQAVKLKIGFIITAVLICILAIGFLQYRMRRKQIRLIMRAMETQKQQNGLKNPQRQEKK